MASNGLMDYAKTGKCHICQRVRKTDEQVKPVGEVRRGFATGHVWECIDTEDCDRVAKERIAANRPDSRLIEISMERGRFKQWVVFT